MSKTPSERDIAVKWASQLDCLKEEWAELQTQEIEQWEAGLEAAKIEVKRLKDDGEWVGGPTDFMSVSKRSRFELDHSAVIGWLLDPCTHHGLGTRFLRNLLTICFPDEKFQDLELAAVELEVPREECRADIVVWGHDFTVIIENKVDALEGDEQCAAYVRNFGDYPDARFVFLTPNGRPSEWAPDDFVPISYHQLAGALSKSLRATTSDMPGKARCVAENYLLTLRKEFT